MPARGHAIAMGSRVPLTSVPSLPAVAALEAIALVGGLESRRSDSRYAR